MLQTDNFIALLIVLCNYITYSRCLIIGTLINILKKRSGNLVYNLFIAIRYVGTTRVRDRLKD